MTQKIQTGYDKLIARELEQACEGRVGAITTDKIMARKVVNQLKR